jgi:hypothetical protein
LKVKISIAQNHFKTVDAGYVIPLTTLLRATRNKYTVEISCICAAETGQNTTFVLFGYRSALGIILGYILDTVWPLLLPFFTTYTWMFYFL